METMITSSMEHLAVQNVVIRNSIFYVFGDGKRVGLVIAADGNTALSNAKKALTRGTASKDDSSPDYMTVIVVESGF